MKLIRAISTIFLPLFFLTVSPLLIRAETQPILIRHIIDFNLDVLRESLNNGSYKGEEGILMIRPEMAESLGMKVYIDQDYLDSNLLFERAEKSLEKARAAMNPGKKEKYPGEYSKIIVDSFLKYREEMESAKSKLMAYRGRISKDNDERLDDDLCYGIMEKMLDEGLKKNNYRLRDALGHFYNRCHGSSSNGYPLTPGNIRFVNHVFNGFLQNSNEEAVRIYDLDQDVDYWKMHFDYNWKEAAGREIMEIAGILEKAFHDSVRKRNYPVDPLLFISLLKKESAFNPIAVSSVGAAGLTQIMPGTAIDMGMKNIYMPDYFNESMSLLKQEREIRKEAIKTLFLIKTDTDIKYAEIARELMQKSSDLGITRRKLFNRYQKELLTTNNTDDRLDPGKAVEYGLKYFSKLLREHDGDISLALASYNAGPHRVKEYKGIPPFVETLGFRNRILEFYRDYHQKAMILSSVSSK